VLKAMEWHTGYACGNHHTVALQVFVDGQLPTLPFSSPTLVGPKVPGTVLLDPSGSDDFVEACHSPGAHAQRRGAPPCIFASMIHITTSRLILRDLEETDVDGIFALDSDPEVLRFIGTPVMKERSEAERR
jgi:hypothetical protein